MELDFDKYCVVDGSPTTVLPSPRHRSKPPYKKTSERLKYEKNYIPSLSENFAEISFNRFRSASCKDVRPKRSNYELPKRGSVYQSSKEVNFTSKTDFIAGRKKIELSRESTSKTSHFGILDSLCSVDEDSPLDDRNRSSVASTSAQSSYSINYSFPGKSGKLSSNKPSVNLHKSLSAKLDLPHSPARPRTHIIRPEKIGHDFKNETIRKPENSLVSLSSPAHLQGILKLENKNGVPFFEFSVKSTEDVCYVGRTWKVDNALTWVYTFHSVHNKRKSNASGWVFKDHHHQESAMVGQMVMSCYLCTELKGAGAFNDSMVTEYVLYDIAQTRRSVSSQDNSGCSPDISKVPLVSDCERSNKGRVFNHPPQPLAISELRTELQTAAIIMRVPFEKRESLKFKSGDSKMDLCRDEGAKKGNFDNAFHGGTMHVVVPAGNHSLPSVESRGPSPLLDRWRIGGGCDCGGWDMACPLDVFRNPCFQVAEGQTLMDGQEPVKLFVQGRKDNDIPAFTMRAIEEGKYAVDFHAQLSSLQAFSVCVSILHAAEASTLVGQEQSKEMLQSDSLRVFAEEEIKNLIEAISEEDKFLKGSYNNRKDEVLAPSFVLNPPFSPIGRV